MNATKQQETESPTILYQKYQQALQDEAAHENVENDRTGHGYGS